jgi:hypothetical protein
MIPDKVFIVPYRNREPQKKVFETVMPTLLKDHKYNILFIHQQDARPFNRGAMKNIGFLYVKKEYPENYKNMTLIFHDIDFIAYKKDQFNYDTKPGIVKHFFGYTFTLGGIVSVNAGDFEKTNGFPNIWTWGLEDNVFQKRCIKQGFLCDRSNFLRGGADEDKLITLWHGWDRLINPTIKRKFTTTSNIDGFSIIKGLSCNKDKISENVFIVNVTSFKTGEDYRVATYDATFKNSRYNQTFKNPTKIVKHNPISKMKSQANKSLIPRTQNRKRFDMKF